MATDSRLTILSLHFDGRTTAQLLLAGELDLETGCWLDDAVAGLLAVPGLRRVEVDVALLGFCDAGGLSSLVTAHKGAADRGVALYLIQIRAPLRKVLDAAGLGNLLAPPNGTA